MLKKLSIALLAATMLSIAILAIASDYMGNSKSMKFVNNNWHIISFD